MESTAKRPRRKRPRLLGAEAASEGRKKRRRPAKERADGTKRQQSTVAIAERMNRREKGHGQRRLERLEEPWMRWASSTPWSEPGEETTPQSTGEKDRKGGHEEAEVM
jgi:hypothetical protein